MFKKIFRLGVAGLLLASLATSCSDEQQFTNENTDARRIEVSQLTAEMAKVRDYVPLYAVAAHRVRMNARAKAEGSTLPVLLDMVLRQVPVPKVNP